ncbi:MAG: NAD(P)-dependent oxidoreductase [bacterium]
MTRVLLTGAAGGIGTAFREAMRDRFSFVCFDRVATPGEPGAVVADLTDLPALERAAAGCDAVVHLAARRDEDDFLTRILPDNIVGTYHVFEAARRAKVGTFVFASSVQAEERPERGMVTPDQPPVTLNTYAASKVLGEHLGLMYAHRYKMAVICLRMGWVSLPVDLEELKGHGRGAFTTVLTVRDCCGILAAAVTAAGVEYAILPAMSRTAAAIRDLSLLERTIGYAPQDDALELFDRGAF